ncbi:MAG: methylated-DNA--[protein]-cysteine S-methyltransferase [Puniceicoccales bacterium]|jgi:methylated-DNA-[protein]-cysteine S-methyltransferase|nr:methylated-DNA--[protein]-cysteine S-methyltransferase [Puniceicoccales bacterium]
MQNVCIYKTEIGRIAIATEGSFLTNIFYKRRLYLLKKCEFFGRETEDMKNIFKQIEEYLRGERKIFDVQMALRGTDFQKKVWEQLLGIPYGETRSYKEIARQIGVPKGARAVGMANNKNPIPLIVPCHRVIGAAGDLVGYGGGLDLKQKLLALENSHSKDNNL